MQEHPLLKKRNKSGWERRELYNQYHDTPGRELARAKVALRMRRDGEQYIQTLKSRRAERGRAVRTQRVGLVPGKEQARPEETRRQVLAGGPQDLDKKQLKPIFSTDFVRQRAEIAWGRGKGQGSRGGGARPGQGGRRRQPGEICELELELRQGDAATLLELAAELAADLPLMPCDISKAERGYRLFDPNSYEVDPPAQKLLAETPGRCLRRHRLVPARQQPATGRTVSLQRPTGACWRTGCNTCRTLHLLGSLGQAVPRASSREAARSAGRLADWAPRIERGRDDETLRQQAPPTVPRRTRRDPLGCSP